MIRIRDWIGARNANAGAALAAVCAVIVGLSALGSIRLVVTPTAATLSKQDDWQYRSGWPSGYAYADASRYLSASLESGARIAYAIDFRHRVGAGFLHDPPAGITSLGLVSISKAAELAATPGTYLLVDDIEDDPPEKRMRALTSRAKSLKLVATFRRPGSDSGAYLLRSGG